MNKCGQNSKNKNAFTIVELLVVIVVIGILAAISIVSYSGISNRAKIATLQSDLSNASKQIKLFQATENSNSYPTANNCQAPDATEICLKPSSGNVFAYVPSNSTNPKTFILKATNGTLVYQITDNSAPQVFVSLAVSDPAKWVAIGTQVWAKANLDVGTMITGTTAQTNNAVLEKYCYNDSLSNCTTYGGLYQWNEAMQYFTTEGAQGICPAGSHIPSDNDWKILEVQLGMTQLQADATGDRGTDQGTRLKSGGISGLNIPLAGYRSTAGSFSLLLTAGYLWSSSNSGAQSWFRNLFSGNNTVFRDTFVNIDGLSVRCIES